MNRRTRTRRELRRLEQPLPEYNPELYIPPIEAIAHQIPQVEVMVACRVSTTNQWNNGNGYAQHRLGEIELACLGISIAAFIYGVFNGADPSWIEKVRREADSQNVTNVVFLSLSRCVRGSGFDPRNNIFAEPTDDDLRSMRRTLGDVTPYTILPASTPWQQEQRFLSRCGAMWRAIDDPTRYRKSKRRDLLAPLARRLVDEGGLSYRQASALVNVPVSTLERWTKNSLAY